VLLPAFVAGCDEVERHKTLTFFFDGVPPLMGEEVVTKKGQADSDSQKLSQMQRKSAWFVHEPRKDCTLCHGKRRQKGFSLRTYLTAPVPGLCYNCHADYTVSASFVHGPVAVGQCLFCHNPHKSKIEHLLNEPEPKLCYLCHNIKAVELIPAHLTKQTSACTDCHEAHASSTKALLKAASSQINEELDETKAISILLQNFMQDTQKKDEKSSIERTEITHTTLPESQSLFQVLWKVSKLIEQGELQEARVYLEKFKDNSAFIEEERRKIALVLKKMDIAATTTEGNSKKIRQERTVIEGKPSAEPGESLHQLSNQKRLIAELYYRSMAYYRAGQLIKAKEGFLQVLKSGFAPAPIVKTIASYLVDIDNTLAGRAKPSTSK
jgi:predicted CXXCH cytochrome family protein